MLLSPFGSATEAIRILHARFVAKPKRPGFLLFSRAGRYALHYHAEHLPNADSTIGLSATRDALGRQRAKIDLRFSERDARSVLAAHEQLDIALRQSGIGHLDYTLPEGEQLGSVMAQARDGMHQIGTTRAGIDPASSVVDGNLKVHGIDNLFVASSSVFPTSGQANPTLLAVALSYRLADHLAGVAAR